MRIVIAFLGAVAGCYVLGATFVTNHVANNLQTMGVDVPLALRLQMMGHDLLGLTSLYLPILAVALLVGFVVAALLLKVPALAAKRTAAYIGAGALAIFALNIALLLPFETHLLAATRSTLGLVLQVAAGAVGGWLFALLSRRNIAA